MFRYTIGRLIGGLLTVFFIATATFFVMHAVPGDPLLSEKMTDTIKENLKKQYGLDKPLYIQYFRYLGAMAQGDFGISYAQENRSVNDIIAKHFPISATLGVLALMIAAFGGIILGAITAKFRNRAPDSIIMISVIIFISVPSFVVASLFVLGVGNFNELIGLELLPAQGWPAEDASFLSYFKYMLLPALALGLYPMAYLTRLTRSSVLEQSNSDYIRTAKAKGVPSGRIFLLHELRNSVLPVITVLGPLIAGITTGGFVVETIFIVPGLGKYFVEAVQQLDYTVIMGLTVFYGGFLVFMVLAVDIVYGFVDPRIRVNK